MRVQTKTLKIVYTAVCLALAVVLPLAFHSIPNSAEIFCPIHIPVLLCGIILGWKYGLAAGLLSPLLSMLATGMPNLLSLVPMMFECGVYGLIGGLLMQKVKTGNLIFDLYIAMASAMILGRIVGGILKAVFVVIFSQEVFTLYGWAVTYFAVGLPAIIIQLVLIPAVYISLKKAGLVPKTELEKSKKI